MPDTPVSRRRPCSSSVDNRRVLADARASARFSARSVKTGIIARRYSALAWMSELTSSSVAPALRAAASMLAADAGFPASAFSTSVRRVACELAPVRPMRAD